jgi:hypothetical protein
MRLSVSLPLALMLLKCSAFLVPRRDRNEWLAEWTGELTYVVRQSHGGASQPIKAILFSLGSFRDAGWLRWDRVQTLTVSHFGPGSWGCCLGTLFGLLVVTCACSRLELGFARAPFSDLYDVRLDSSMPNVVLQILIAICALPAMTSLELGHYPPSSSRPGRIKAVCFWTFLFMKATMIVTVSHYVGLCITHIAESLAIVGGFPETYRAIREGVTPLQFLATFGSCLFGLRWVLRDQRRRCPVCLDFLSAPLLKGQQARVFLFWSRSEEVCLNGHGLLLVPEVRTRWVAAQTWQHIEAALDPILRASESS